MCLCVDIVCIHDEDNNKTAVKCRCSAASLMCHTLISIKRILIIIINTVTNARCHCSDSQQQRVDSEAVHTPAAEAACTATLDASTYHMAVAAECRAHLLEDPHILVVVQPHRVQLELLDLAGGKLEGKAQLLPRGL